MDESSGQGAGSFAKEPENGVLELNCTTSASTIVAGFGIAGIIGYVAPMILADPRFPDWTRHGFFSWGLGILILLIILGIDYQDVIFLEPPRRVTRMRFYTIPLINKCDFIDYPYHLKWERMLVPDDRKSRTGFNYVRRLTAPRLGSYDLWSYKEYELPGLETMNAIGESYAKWNDGKVFHFTPLKEEDYPEVEDDEPFVDL